MPQLFNKLSHKQRKRRPVQLDELSMTPRDPAPATDIEMTIVIGRTITTATTTTGVMTTTIATTTIAEVRTTADGTNIAAASTIAATTTTIVTRSTIGRMTIVVTIIATTTFPTDGTQGTTKGTTGRKMYARSDGVYPTTTRKDHAPEGLNHLVRGSIKKSNWYR